MSQLLQTISKPSNLTVAKNGAAAPGHFSPRRQCTVKDPGRQVGWRRYPHLATQLTSCRMIVRIILDKLGERVQP
jgi:hypothetical protein